MEKKFPKILRNCQKNIRSLVNLKKEKLYSINVWIWEAWTAHLILISEFHHTFLSRKVWAFCQKNCVHSYLPKHCWYLQPFPTFLTNLIRLPSFNNSANGQQTWFARHLSTMVRMVNKPGSLAIFQQWREWSTNDLWSDIILAFILKMWIVAFMLIISDFNIIFLVSIWISSPFLRL